MFDSLKEKFKQFFKKEAQLEKKVEKEIKITPTISLATKIKKTVIGKAQIKEKDIEGLLFDFNLSLLESDVAVPVANEICSRIRKTMVGKEISKKEDVKKITEQVIKKTLEDILEQEKINLIEKIKNKKPFVILFVGPNGHGKSSSVGKVAYYFKKNNLSSVISASDTFRAAAIEQIEKIAAKISVKVIKHKYGADPAAVAFDSIEFAKAHGIDVVLIDTAGRSELNINLMEQMKKIVRVARPDLKIYVGEALAGNAAVEEAKKFNEAIGLDGAIITKVDCDVKGGSLLSISHVINKPVLFIGTGQKTEDFIPFEKEWFIEKILG